MRTIVITLKNGNRVLIEIGPEDNPEEVLREHEIKTTIKYQFLRL